MNAFFQKRTLLCACCKKNVIVFDLAQSNQLLGLREMVCCTAPCSVQCHDLAPSKVEKHRAIGPCALFPGRGSMGTVHPGCNSGARCWFRNSGMNLCLQGKKSQSSQMVGDLVQSCFTALHFLSSIADKDLLRSVAVV